MRGVSPVWQDTPAYYFWIDKAPCVYSLEFSGASRESRLGVEFVDCETLVRAFPFRNSDLYNCFSDIEKKALNGPFFDGSNTPRVEYLEKLDQNLFIISRIEWLYAESGLWNIFALNALDSSITRGDFRPDDSQLSQGPTVNSILRKIPSWRISLPLFDMLNSLYALYSRTKPQRVRLTAEPGFEYVSSSADEIQLVENKSVQSLNLTTFFGSDPGSENIAHQPHSCVAKARDSEQAIFDLTFNPRDVCDYGFEVPSYENKMGQHWWTISDVQFDSLMTCPCGCNHD